MLYTGYFAKTKHYEEAGLIPVSVARRTPTFFKGLKWNAFAPKEELFVLWKAETIDDEEYIRDYIDGLCRSVTREALSNIKELAKKKDIVLCCYEKSGDFCHRTYLGKWLSSTLGIEVREWTFE